MPVDRCRACGLEFFESPRLRYENMPKAAQMLPDESVLQSEKGVDVEVCQCSGCGLVQLSNDPVHYYREVIRAAAFSPEMKAFRTDQFGRFVEKHSLRGKKAVEIGCGGGEYLSLIQRAGMDAFGVEYSREAVDRCREEGLQVTRGFVESENYRVEHAPFDAFFILNFLEHLPDPNATLRGIYHNLTDQAAGMVEVPNFDMILRQRLFSEFIGDHLLYFTKETLTTTLVRNGFEIIECNVVWHDYVISATVRKRSRIDMSGFSDSQGRQKKELSDYIDSFGEKQVAIWGAGHQALAVISLADLAGRVRYVVDSATFKQGRYTPATHIPIVAPETLNTDPVEGIIVMAASYSDEVAGILKQKYNNTIKIAILRESGLEVL